MAFKTLITALAIGASLIAAAPTTTNQDLPSRTVPLTGVTHSVVAGLGGLRFDPDNVVAEVGDLIEWHFLPKNHSIAQSNFANPCRPLADGSGFFSGFKFVTQEGQAPDVFRVVVEDDSKPIWYYCAQQVGNHCQAGMSGVVNQNFDNQDFSLRRYKEVAALSGTSIIPAVVQGGETIPNPNPLGGFKF